jgi:N-acetylglucosaminyldiphosphoundecaprenol N-acetyl-beta-D-mannosaminyltransferase
MMAPEADGLALEPGPRPRVELLGYPIDRVSMDEAVERCRSFLNGDRRPRLVITLNAAVLALAEQHEPLARVISGGDLVLADGVSILWATRLLGGRLRDRVAGVDLMERLTTMAHDHRLRLYFLGARPEVVRKVAERVEVEHPGAVVVGARDGYFQPEDWGQVIEQIRESRADMLFVAMPTPFKEIWCGAHLEDLGVPVVLPVGGAFDVFAGFIPRAPRWMQDHCLEWFWRLMMEPRGKWRRYLTLNTSFVLLCLKAWLRRRREAAAKSTKAQDGN